MAKKETKLHMWLGKHPLLTPDDENWVETQAAVHEFGENKLPRDEAEGRAYRDYQNRHSAMAAAHHLVGQRSTVGEESQKHALMYALHLKSMGYDPTGPVPDAVKAYMNSDEFEHPVKFKAHKGDALLIHSAEPKDHDRFGKSEDSLVDRLQHLRSVVGLAIAVEKVGNAIVDSEASRLERLHKALSYAVTLDRLCKTLDVQPGAKRPAQGNCRNCGENIVAKRQQLREQGKIQLLVHNNFCSTDCEDAFIAKRFVKPAPTA